MADVCPAKHLNNSLCLFEFMFSENRCPSQPDFCPKETEIQTVYLTLCFFSVLVPPVGSASRAEQERLMPFLYKVARQGKNALHI